MQRVVAGVMNLFLRRFANWIAVGVQSVLVLDQAGGHTTNALDVPSNVMLSRLPPYSPELNPVERVWLYLRERYLSDRLLADFRACCKA